MTIDKDGLAPCGGCGNDDPAKRCIGCMHQFHTAIPNTGDELVAKLRAMCIDWDARPMDDGELPRIEPHCRDLREAADAITSLTAECEALTRRASSDDRRKRMFRRNVRLRLDAEARAQAAEASLASAREDALEEAAKVHEAEIAMIQGHLAGDEIDQYSYSKLVLLLGSHHNSLSAIRALKEVR